MFNGYRILATVALAFSFVIVVASGGCSAIGASKGKAETPPESSVGPDRDALRAQAKAIFGTLPSDAADPSRPISTAEVDLGRTLYYDPRLSKNHDISCNSCHQLDAFGADGEPTSPGH